MAPEITCDRGTEFSYPIGDVGTDQHSFNLVYEPGRVTERKLFALQIHTDGDHRRVRRRQLPGRPRSTRSRTSSSARIPSNAKHWSEIKQALRKFTTGWGWDRSTSRCGTSPANYYDAPIHELLGTYRTEVPRLRLHVPRGRGTAVWRRQGLRRLRRGVSRDGLRRLPRSTAGAAARDRATSTADQRPRSRWASASATRWTSCATRPVSWRRSPTRSNSVVRSTKPASTGTGTPYRDGGISQHSHNKLAQKLDTPILQTEARAGTRTGDGLHGQQGDRLHAGRPEYDAGITGAMKRAKVAEGFGLDVGSTHPARPSVTALQPSGTPTTTNSRWSTPTAQNPAARLRGDYSDMIDTIGGRTGWSEVPHGPGLGVDYDWDYIGDNATGSVHVVRVVHRHRSRFFAARCQEPTERSRFLPSLIRRRRRHDVISTSRSGRSKAVCRPARPCSGRRRTRR